MNWAISKGEMRVCVCSVHGKKWTAHRNMVVKIWKKRSTLKILVEAGKLLHGIYTEVTSRYIYTEVTLRYIYRSYFTVYIQKLLHGIYIYIYIYTEVTSRYIYTEVTSRYRYRSYFTVYIQKLLHGIYIQKLLHGIDTEVTSRYIYRSYFTVYIQKCESKWLRDLRRVCAAARLLGLRVRIPPRA